VTVAGQYRTGKSFLLNKIMGLKGDGFKVDPSVTACTQGMWIWSQPVYVQKDNKYIFFIGRLILYIFFMKDTEGCNSTNRTKNHDSKIFALSMLISNLYIFNTFGCIDD
jgi:hypothetical protein